jgi:hypothetical protein
MDRYPPKLLFAAVTIGAISSAPAQSLLAVPGETAVVTLHAEGAQIYECKVAKNGGLAWQFREPIATLLFNGRTVGRHYAGPSWEHVDGSAVTGKAIGSAPGKSPADIPWLTLEITDHHGTGTFSNVTTVQRINTRGGIAIGACDEAGSYRSAPYEADYVFSHKKF